MNVYELLLNEKALGNALARSAIAEKILSGEISALVTVHPATPVGLGTAGLIRFTVSNQSKSYQESPLNIPRFRKALDDMAIGERPDVETLRKIEVDVSAITSTNQASTNTTVKPLRISSKGVIPPYLAKLIATNTLVKAKDLYGICIKVAGTAESPFATYQNKLTLKGSSSIISSEVFAAWFTAARKLIQNP